MKVKEQFPAIVTLGYMLVWLSVELFVMSRHELWLDEAHHWLLAKDSASLGELFTNMRYEGHAPAWSVLLFLLSRISDSGEMMQVVHLCFSAGTVLLILRYAPFPRWVKLILPFTYFFCFEYAVIARNYAPAVFFLLLAVVLYTRRRHLLLTTLCLGMAFLFHSYAGIIAAVLFGWIVMEEMRAGKTYRTIVGPLLLFFVLTIPVVITSRPPEDHFLFPVHGPQMYSLNRAGSVLGLSFKSLLHFPDLSQANWWNTNQFLPANNWLQLGLVTVFLLISILVFVRSKQHLLIYLGGVILISIATFITPMPLSVRHAGMMAILFFLVLWLLLERMPDYFIRNRPLMVIVMLILAVQFAGGITTLYSDACRPFSQAKNTAAYIRKNYSGMDVIVYPQYTGPAISYYLGGKVYYTERETYGSFAGWKAERFIISPQEMYQSTIHYMERNDRDAVILVAHEDVVFDWSSDLRVEEHAAFTGAAVDAENYRVYVLSK